MITCFVIRVLICLILIDSLRGESPALVLEKAHQKEVLAELAPAVALYRRVVSNPANGLRWRAQGTMGLARCHERMESYVTANSHYLTVIKEYGQFKKLVDSASERILEISRILAQDGGVVSGGDYLYLNDLVISLHGAYRNDDRNLASEVFEDLERHLESLSNEVAGTGEDDLINQSVKELAGVGEAARASFASAAKRLERAENLGLFIEIGFEDDPGELFNPVLRWKDRLHHFLTEGNVGKAMRFAERIEEYLEPLTETPGSDEQKLALHLRSQAAEIWKALDQENLPAARRTLYLGDKKRHQEDLLMAVYLDGFEYLPVNHLPLISASSDWLENALGLIENDPERANTSVGRALELSVRLQKMTDVPDFKKENATFIEDLKQVIVALEAGETKKAKGLLDEVVAPIE